MPSIYALPALHASCSVVVSRICLHALRRDGTGWVCWLWPKLPLLWRLAWAPCPVCCSPSPPPRAAVSSSPESAFTHSAAMALAGFAGWAQAAAALATGMGPMPSIYALPSPPRELQCRRHQNLPSRTPPRWHWLGLAMAQAAAALALALGKMFFFFDITRGAQASLGNTVYRGTRGKGRGSQLGTSRTSC